MKNPPGGCAEAAPAGMKGGGKAPPMLEGAGGKPGRPMGGAPGIRPAFGAAAAADAPVVGMTFTYLLAGLFSLRCACVRSRADERTRVRAAAARQLTRRALHVDDPRHTRPNGAARRSARRTALHTSTRRDATRRVVWCGGFLRELLRTCSACPPVEGRLKLRRRQRRWRPART